MESKIIDDKNIVFKTLISFTMKLSYLLNQTFICQLCNRLIMVQIPFLGKDVITHCWENNIIIKVNKCLLIFLCFIYSYPPFFDENTFKIYEKILEGKIEWPRHLDPSKK
jgi:hypothetical protein